MSSPVDAKRFSEMTVRARRRALARRISRIGEECDDFAVHELTAAEGALDDRIFLDKREKEALEKNVKALQTMAKNLQVLSKRIIVKTDDGES